MPNPLTFLLSLTIAVIIVSISLYLIKTSAFKKGKYGKDVVTTALKKFSSPRKMTVLSDVSISDGNKTATFDHVLIGYFGVLFLQSIQGKGSFYGDSTEKVWTFTQDKEKITFVNPLDEMEEKIELFRSVLGKNKIYNVPVESAVVVIGLGDEPKLYLSNVAENAVLTEKTLLPFLRSSKFELDNQIDPEAIAALFHK